MSRPETSKDDLNELLEQTQVTQRHNRTPLEPMIYEVPQIHDKPSPPDEFATGDINSNKKGSGARRNRGKVSFSIVPMHLLSGVARILMGGSLKYAPYNWSSGMKWSVCMDCAFRHIFKFWYMGEELDEESGETHLDHAICNLMFLKHYMAAYKEGDDRPPTFTGFKESLDEFNKKFDEEDFKKRTGYVE